VSQPPLRIAHVINLKSWGGAELVLLRLLADGNHQAFEHLVVSLSVPGPELDRFASAGIETWALGFRSPVTTPWHLLRLRRRLGEFAPHVVQTWMYHADLLGGLAAQAPVCWNIRRTTPGDSVKRATGLTAGLCARLSHRLPTRIVCCGQAAQRHHAALGYAADRMVVIPNGFDTHLWRPDPALRKEVRRELGVGDDVLLVGLMARYMPVKNHALFLQAASLVARVRDDVQFVCCGRDVGPAHGAFAAAVAAAGLTDRVHALGHRGDLPRLNAALDVACSSSLQEGFPNVVGEAMACGVPCVVTDVGDSALLVGDTGKVVPPADTAAFASALATLLALSVKERAGLGERARARIEEHFSLPVMIDSYQDLWATVSAAARRETNR